VLGGSIQPVLFFYVWVIGFFRPSETSSWGTGWMVVGLVGVVTMLVLIGRSRNDAPAGLVTTRRAADDESTQDSASVGDSLAARTAG
jgi:hypothetical protein